MPVSILKIINLALLLVMLIFIARYAWTLLWGKGYAPPHWEHEVAKGTISRKLRKILNEYEDKIRFYTFWLQIERLKQEKIPGCFAELGVYKGESARILHHMDPGRDLHLFDTFDGLPVKDLAIETGEASTYTNKNFKDTSIDKVIQNIGGNEQKIFYHKGYFPESASGSEDLQFALVNLDADLYNPTLAALRFFYPRLSKGGVIFIHDYNHKWEGLQKAVDEFISEIPETLVLIPDADSTVMIVKSGLEA